MKRYYYKCTFIILIACLIFLTACSSNKVTNKLETQSENLKLATELATEDLEGEIEILQAKQINGTHYIVLRLFHNGSNTQLWKYTGASATLLEEGANIHIEARNPYLYCKVGKNLNTNEEYKEKVVKFDVDNNKSLIYEGTKGIQSSNLEISASPDGEYFILIENKQGETLSLTTRNLKILDKNDEIIYDELIPSELFTKLSPLDWNSSKFWTTLNYPYDSHSAFFILDTETLKYEIIENKARYFESELNINTGWICYSTYPHFFDIDAYNDFSQSDEEVDLYLWNIYTDEKIKIDTAIAKSFAPRWIDDYTFEYSNPDNKPKIVYKLNSNN